MPFSDELTKKIDNCLLMGEELKKSMRKISNRRIQMNDMRRPQAGAALVGNSCEVAPKQASLTEMIDSDLNRIIDRSLQVQSEISELEGFLFGPSDTNMKDSPDTPAPSTWQQKIRYRLDQISCIQDRQLEILESISRFHK